MHGFLSNWIKRKLGWCLQGMMSTLELLPMWGGAEPDVELFFSGNVVGDDGEWAGGQSLGEVEDAGAHAAQLSLFPKNEQPVWSGVYAKFSPAPNTKSVSADNQLAG